MRIEILESAREDLNSGRAFYESQRSGLGAYFLDSLSSDIESLLLYAGIHPLYFDRYHRLLSNRFPFAVYYRTEGDLVRQDPGRIADRLK